MDFEAGPRGGDATLGIVIEKLRLAGYAAFWVVVVTGISLTRLFSGVDLDDAVMTQVFGYANVCVYFDHPPANYVLPWLWAGTLTLLLGYIGAQWLLMRGEVQRGTLARRPYRAISGLKLFEAVTLVAFSTSFAVSPEGRDVTLYFHSVPFFLVQLGLVSLAMSNTLHGFASGYWERLRLPRWFTSGAVVYCWIFALVVAFKIPYATNAMMGAPWWDQGPELIRFAAFVDVLFLVLAAVVPMLKAGFLVVFKGDELQTLRLTPSVATS